MPSLSQTKKVVKVLVVSEMNIASGATDMVFTFFFFFFWGGGGCVFQKKARGFARFPGYHRALQENSKKPAENSHDWLENPA